MSFESIVIHRDLPIINRRIIKPPNDPVNYIDIADATNPTVINLSLGSGSQTGAKFGYQEFVRLPGITPDTWYTTDPLTGL